jgi:predicted metal-dependent phosphotriesterase family hydrolase
MFIGKLLENGFKEQDIQRMVRDNPAQVLGARTTAAAAV